MFHFKIFNFLYYLPRYDLQKTWRHDDYYHMREVTFFKYVLNHNSSGLETWSTNTLFINFIINNYVNWTKIVKPDKFPLKEVIPTSYG